MNNQLWNFLAEFVNRLKSKSPKFFQILQYISIASAIITGLPGVLEEAGVILPAWAAVLQSKLAGWLSVLAWVFAKLPVESTPIAVTQAGDVVKVSSEKLPFTKKDEEKKTEDLPAAQTIK